MHLLEAEYAALFLIFGFPLLLLGTLWVLVYVGFLPKPFLKARPGGVGFAGMTFPVM